MTAASWGGFDWTPLLHFPSEWAALGLLVAGCLYWERAGFSGLGVEGCVASAMLGLIAGYEGTGSYPAAIAIAAGAAVAFALAAGGLLQLFRADMAVGSFCLSLVPACALGLVTRAGPFAIFTENPAPGLIRGTIFDGTLAEDLVANPALWAAPILIALAAWLLWQSPFGLRLRAFGESPGLRVPGVSGAFHRFLGIALGALWTVPAAALLVRESQSNPPAALGFLALACVVAGRWSFAAALLLAAGPALLRTARPYAEGLGGWSIAGEMAPFLLGFLYLL
ncbi:MAG: hypothetical protein ACM3JJ_00285, partial [Hyphomicrobiales bacterium]